MRREVAQEAQDHLALLLVQAQALVDLDHEPHVSRRTRLCHRRYLRRRRPACLARRALLSESEPPVPLLSDPLNSRADIGPPTPAGSSSAGSSLSSVSAAQPSASDPDSLCAAAEQNLWCLAIPGRPLTPLPQLGQA